MIFFYSLKCVDFIDINKCEPKQYHNIKDKRYIMDYDYLTSPIQVTVPSFKSDSSAVFFCIQLQSSDNKWYVDKRFS